VTLENLLKRQPFEHIVIELSGLADPGPLIEIFWCDTELEAEVYLDAVVCVCDAQHILDHLKNTKEAAQQIAMSDRVILNKCDLVSDEAASHVVAALEAINGVNSVLRTVQSNANLQMLLNIRAFDAEKTAERFNNSRVLPASVHAHEHSSDISTVRLSISGPLDKSKLRAFLASLLWEGDSSYDILRLKGLISMAGKPVKYALQGVREVWNLEKTNQAADANAPLSDFVFIGRNMRIAEWEKALELCKH
jgi:G3E family GTPase